ncbi:RNA-directed DNA polymerase, eukaryota, reverse transcriptase zinc-binding domain protein [Tanacetum coccineum]
MPQGMVKKNKSSRLANYIIDKEEFKDLVKEKWEQISVDEANLMIRDVSDDGIKKALFDIDDNKAPGPDVIKDFFTTGKILGKVNATLICLVPKMLTPQKIVDDNQSAFVPGRAITDNILLTKELLKGYNGPKRCSFKIDIQKAYDTVCWSFIEDILRRFGFLGRMVKWIMTFISSPKFTICVNGERYGYFNGGRGLRQGDPISLYIFTVVMEMLNLLIKGEIRKDKSFKYHFGCKQLKITHLCFADDLIMLCHGDMNSLATLKRSLDKFSSVSELYPNLSKCTMFCGSLGDDTKDEISSIFPFKEGKLLVRYLGVSLVTMKIGIADCNQLVEKVKWINVVKLKQRSVWDVEIDSKDSWGWKCLLNLRSWVGSHMRYKIGDGKSINMCHDKWNSESDQAIWVDSNGNEKRFSTNNVWKDVRGNYGKVECSAFKIEWENEGLEDVLERTTTNWKWCAGYGLDIVVAFQELAEVGYLLWLEANLVMPYLLAQVVRHQKRKCSQVGLFPWATPYQAVMPVSEM